MDKLALALERLVTSMDKQALFYANASSSMQVTSLIDANTRE